MVDELKELICFMNHGIIVSLNLINLCFLNWFSFQKMKTMSANINRLIELPHFTRVVE